MTTVQTIKQGNGKPKKNGTSGIIITPRRKPAAPAQRQASAPASLKNKLLGALGMTVHTP